MKNKERVFDFNGESLDKIIDELKRINGLPVEEVENEVNSLRMYREQWEYVTNTHFSGSFGGREIENFNDKIESRERMSIEDFRTVDHESSKILGGKIAWLKNLEKKYGNTNQNYSDKIKQLEEIEGLWEEVTKKEKPFKKIQEYFERVEDVLWRYTDGYATSEFATPNLNQTINNIKKCMDYGKNKYNISREFDNEQELFKTLQETLKLTEIGSVDSFEQLKNAFNLTDEQISNALRDIYNSKEEFEHTGRYDIINNSLQYKDGKIEVLDEQAISKQICEKVIIHPLANRYIEAYEEILDETRPLNEQKIQPTESEKEEDKSYEQETVVQEIPEQVVSSQNNTKEYELENLSIEDLENIATANEHTIESNSEEIKKQQLIAKIREQQKTIKEQEEKMAELSELEVKNKNGEVVGYE